MEHNNNVYTLIKLYNDFYGKVTSREFSREELILIFSFHMTMLKYESDIDNNISFRFAPGFLNNIWYIFKNPNNLWEIYKVDEKNNINNRVIFDNPYYAFIDILKQNINNSEKVIEIINYFNETIKMNFSEEELAGYKEIVLFDYQQYHFGDDKFIKAGKFIDTKIRKKCK